MLPQYSSPFGRGYARDPARQASTNVEPEPSIPTRVHEADSKLTLAENDRANLAENDLANAFTKLAYIGCGGPTMHRDQTKVFLISAALCIGGCAGKVDVTPTVEEGGVETPAEAAPTCPPDPSATIQERACSAARESPAGKIDLRSQINFEAAAGEPSEVMIQVEGGAGICQLDSCAEKSCPAADEIRAFWVQQNLASQKCVRDLVETLGGRYSGEAFWLVNAFGAELTWPQIQIVATHPDVLHIDPSSQ